MTNLVKATAVPQTVPAPVARPPAPVPSASRNDPASASRRVAAVQRTLTEYGYGQLKPTGTVGSETQAAIQKFERDRKIPGDRAGVRSPGARTRRDDRQGDRLEIAWPHGSRRAPHR